MKMVALISGAILITMSTTAFSEPSERDVLSRLEITLASFFKAAGRYEGASCESDAPKKWKEMAAWIRPYLEPAWPKIGPELQAAIDKSQPDYDSGWQNGRSFCGSDPLGKALKGAISGIASTSKRIKQYAEMLQ